MPDFDPYHKWLGIPPQHQPPNYYRLLALDLYESDLEVIEAAVDRLVFFLQDVATGPQAKHSQKLLNEIAAARLCLLDRQRKSTYDEQLRAESDDEMPPPVVDIEPGPIPVPPAQKRLTVNERFCRPESQCDVLDAGTQLYYYGGSLPVVRC
ncbi:MAG: hypothetical protein HYV60_08730 [Planctomycetia bacterium]|nr:hypothetical protein [Planctomycetia bacterium]